MDKQWAAYYDAFRNDAHTLLWRGYLAARHTITGKLEEPAITGLISKAIDEILDSPDIEERFDRYEVHEEKPQNTHGRLGKTRRRTDILLKSNQFRPRRKYIFEAKRLSGLASVRNGYLGTDGLLRFVSGEYAADNSHASMVGYVIKGTVNSIKSIIKNELVAQKDGLKIVNLVDNVTVNNDLEIDVSNHKRAQNSNISISHIILDCC